MKEETRNYEQQGRQGYVPASVKVIEVTVQRVICQSGGTEESPEGNTNDWFI